RLLAGSGLGALPLLPGVGRGRELPLRELIAPVAESALGELLDVALVDQGDAAAPVVDGVLDGGADQPLRAVLRHRLDADAGALREADLAVRLGEVLLEEREEFPILVGAGLELDAGIDV